MLTVCATAVASLGKTLNYNGSWAGALNSLWRIDTALQKEHLGSSLHNNEQASNSGKRCPTATDDNAKSLIPPDSVWIEVTGNAPGTRIAAVSGLCPRQWRLRIPTVEPEGAIKAINQTDWAAAARTLRQLLYAHSSFETKANHCQLPGSQRWLWLVSSKTLMPAALAGRTLWLHGPSLLSQTAECGCEVEAALNTMALPNSPVCTGHSQETVRKREGETKQEEGLNAPR